jgi:hypothetical protein
MHRSCAARYFLRLGNSTASTTNKKSTYPCPACKQEWKKDDVNSVLKANEETNGRQSNGIMNKKQRTSRTNHRIVDESDDDDE